MGLFKKPSDPITDRARELNGRIADLETQIRELNARLEHDQSHPRVRSTAFPEGRVVSGPAVPPPAGRDPIFEDVSHQRVQSPVEPEEKKQDFNEELGIRKYDLQAAWRRWTGQWRGPAAANPKLVNYLAAGSIRGLRPLRYEKRVARTRFLILSGVLLVVLWGLFYIFFRQR